jgi:glycosyltransferase involved in cell wall biosynthesis
LNILIVTQYFWPENFRINDLAAGLQARGHKVTVLTGLPNYPQGSFYDGYGIKGPYTENMNGVRVVRVPLVPRGRKKGLKLALNFASFSVLSCLVAPFRCRESYDAVFVWCVSPYTVALPALLLKALKGVPVYIWVADLWPDTLVATGAIKSRVALRAVTALVKFIYRFSDSILVASKGYRARIEALGVSAEKITYWPQWAESAYTQPLDKEKKVTLPATARGFKILYAGNIGTSQGFPTIVEAASRLKQKADVSWLILGDGAQLPWVLQRVDALGLKNDFHFLGTCPVEDVPYYAAEADALLAALRRDPLFEITVPGKVQSCLACGRPIIASFDGEAAEIVAASGAGFTGAADDVQGLVDAVLRMMALSAEQRAAMGTAGREYFGRHFERDALFSKLESMLSRRGPSLVIADQPPESD